MRHGQFALVQVEDTERDLLDGREGVPGRGDNQLTYGREGVPGRGDNQLTYVREGGAVCGREGGIVSCSIGNT